MTNLTEQQKRKLLAAAEIVQNGDLAVLQKILEFQDSADENLAKLEQSLSDVNAAIEQVNDIQNGVDGVDGRDGKDGQDGRNGVDGRNGRDGRDGKDGVDGVGRDGRDGKDGSSDTADQVRDKLESLTEDNRLDISAIKGLDVNYIDRKTLQDEIEILAQRTQLLIQIATQRSNTSSTSTGSAGHTIQDEGISLAARTKLNFVGAGVAVTDDVGNNATLVTISTSAGAGFQAPSSGVVNGTNTVFVFAVAPNAVSVDGVSLRKVASDTTVSWTGTTTITLSVAPTFDIYGIA